MAYGNGSDYNRMDAGLSIQGGAAGYAATPPVPRTPLITLEAERMSQLTERLHNLIGEFENRISAITRPDGPTTSGQSEKSPAPSVALASILSEMNGRMDGACHRLQSLMNRIEL